MVKTVHYKQTLDETKSREHERAQTINFYNLMPWAPQSDPLARSKPVTLLILSCVQIVARR